VSVLLGKTALSLTQAMKPEFRGGLKINIFSHLSSVVLDIFYVDWD